jgi:putative ABC transport system permease protein
MTWLWHDVRIGLRNILKDRWFFSAAIVALALGIGSTTAIFSVIYNVIFDPYPYRDGKHIFCPEIRELGTSRISNGMTISTFLDFQEQNHIFSDSLGVTEESVLLKNFGQLKEYDADRLTGNAFAVLGMPALFGRGLLPRDALPSAPPVFVLNFRAWVKDFNSDPSVIGKTFELNGTPTTLVGVMPERFSWWAGNLWRPLVLDRADKDHQVVLYGHLRPEISIRSAEADLTALCHRLAKIYPAQFPKSFAVRLNNLIQETIDSYEKTLYLLLGAVGLLLLIACANVSNLLLAKSIAREKELAIRLALGSGRARIIRQLLVESLILAFVGAGAGCFFASACLRALLALLPIWTFPDEADISVNTPVLLATIFIAVVTGILFGIAPALTASRRGVNETLKAGARGNSSLRDGRLRHVLIVSEIAISLVLLTTSGLLMRSFVRQRHAEIGIRTDHLLTSRLNLPAQQYQNTAAQVRFIRELMRQVETNKQVVSTAVSTELPPYSTLSTDFDIEGSVHNEHWNGHFTGCNWQLFPTLGIRLVSGRLLTRQDELFRRHVIVVNQAMSEKYFGKRNAIGERLLLKALRSAPEPIAEPWFEIVGVVSDVKNEGTARKAVTPQAYLPYTVTGFGGYVLFVRTLNKPESMISDLTTKVLELGGRIVVPQYTGTMEHFLEQNQYSRPRFFMTLLALVATIGLLLASVGVYSVISYTVSQQRREIGIRMALGATASVIRSHVLTSTLRFVGLGIGAGFVLTFLFSRIIANQVWGVPWYDPVTLGAVLLLLTGVGGLASVVPAVRASHVAPGDCLRSD